MCRKHVLQTRERSGSVRRDQNGITFIELIIAIAISAIIMAAATMFLGAAHKNYNNASAQIDLQSESQILMEQFGMWVMEGNRVEALDASASDAKGIVIYQIPRTPSVENPDGAADPVTKRVIWFSAKRKKLYTKTTTVTDLTADTTVITAATDERQQNLLGEYVTDFTGSVDEDSKASVTISLKMEYLKQSYEIKNVFKVRNIIR